MIIPGPEPGLVVHFNYLWRREAARGREEARKGRPCALVLAYRRQADGTMIALLAPITHAEPHEGDRAVEIPPEVKAHLGLDDQRSWVIVDEVNETAWPGFDLQPLPDGRLAYGFLPPRLFAKIKAGLREALAARRLGRVTR